MQKIKYIALIPHRPYGNPQHPGSFPRCGNQSSKPIHRKSEHPSETDDRPLEQGAVFRLEFHYIAPILVLYSARPALLLCNQMECRRIFRNRRPQKYLLYDPDLLQPRSRIAAFWHCIRFQNQPTPRPNVRMESAKTQRPLPSVRQGPLCSMSGRSKCERQGSVHRKNSRPFAAITAAQTRMRTHLKKQSNQNGKPPPTSAITPSHRNSTHFAPLSRSLCCCLLRPLRCPLSMTAPI